MIVFIGQLALIVKASLPSVKYRLMHILIFVIGTAALLALLAEFIPMLIIAIVVVGILTAKSSSNSSSSESSGVMFDTGSSSSDDTHSSEPEFSHTLTDESGYERQLTDEGFGTYKDDKGEYWENTGWNGVKRKE